MKPRARRWLLATIPMLFVVITSIIPTIAVVQRGLASGNNGSGGAGSATFRSVLSNPRIQRIVWESLAQATIATLIAMVVGVAAAWTRVRIAQRFGGWAWSLAALPFVLPSVVTATGVRALVGERSGWPLIVIVHAAINVVIVARGTAARLGSIDPAFEDAARLAGRGRFNAAWSTSIRMSAGAIASSSLVAFVFCLTSFGIVLLLGDPTTSTVEIEIWIQATRLTRLDVAAVLSLVQLGIVVIVMTLVTVVQRRHPTSIFVGRPRRGDRGQRIVAGAMSAMLALIGTVPIVGVAARSLRIGDSWGLSNYRSLLSQVPGTTGASTPLQSIVTSAGFAVAASIMALAVGLIGSAIVARSGRLGSALDVALFVPLAVSSATVGFGFLLAYSGRVVDLRDAWFLVPLIEASIAAPLVVRLMVPVIRGVPSSMIEAAAMSGLGPAARFRRVWAPLTAVGVGSAAAIAFAVAFGEFGATAFVSRTASPTMPQMIARLLGRPGDTNIGTAMALATVAALVVSISLVVVERGGRSTALRL